MKQLESPFWRFSLRVYADQEVQRLCLDLQDKYGANVNLVLFSVYLVLVEGLVLTDAALTALCNATSSWNEEVVQPLRKVRKRLKKTRDSYRAFSENVEYVRMLVKRDELEAERVEQGLMWHWLENHRDILPRATDGNDSSSFMSVFRIYGAQERAAHFLECVTSAMNAEGDSNRL